MRKQKNLQKRKRHQKDRREIIVHKMSNDPKYFKRNLKLLPRDVQSKIYILGSRKFWRSYVPMTAQVPSWRKHTVEVEKEIWEANGKNIHFLHLSFNCLPENKKWIMGCQCDFCRNPKSVSKYLKRHETKRQDSDPEYFDSKLMPEHDGMWDTYDGYGFNGPFQMMNNPGLKEPLYYDPLRNSAFEYELLWAMRHPNIPMEFDQDVVDETYAIFHLQNIGL
jgi:hypothetical protein